MWSFIAFTGLFLMLVGVVAIVKPIATIRVPTRGRAALVFLAGVFLFVVGATNDDMSPPEQVAGGSGRSNARESAANAQPVDPDPPRDLLPRGTRWQLLRASDFGERWPFTVTEGFAACPPPGSNVVFVTTNRRIYAVNGRARGYMRKEQNGWREVDEIHRSDPNPTFKDLDPPIRVSVSPIIDVGLKLCE